METYQADQHSISATQANPDPAPRGFAMRRFTVLPSAPLPAPRCGAAWVKALALAAGALLLLPGCKVVTVYDRHGDRLPGIPFVAKKAVRKQETIWQQSGTLVTLVAELEAFPTNKLDLGSVVIGPGGLDGLAALLGTPLTAADTLKHPSRSP